MHLLPPRYTAGVQYSDDVEEDSDDVVEEDAAYPGMCYY